ncbi:DUF427 domain-containing protein [Phyllobacterium sophorae]|uniref:DUF427 domain-containing protein n=1 Tax=Phyllobacterium sophorae TaxID=1520277 RepID=A0A2P7BGF3_9HYPH|nr:DUF427 domain-containing protein [Phyllobacterium sophorae]PSH65509.1 hypothetical protein CU103_09195 [Phyllobacterium sophorae]
MTTDPSPKLQPREPLTPQLVNVLHSPKRIRVEFAGKTIADSRDVLVLRSNQFLPTYFFPADAVKQSLLKASGYKKQHVAGGETRSWDLDTGERFSEGAAWSFVTPPNETFAPLVGRVAFDWKSVDHWFEEDEEVFVHPRDPYARIDALHSSSHVQVWLESELIADSRRPVLLFETHLPTRFYLPASDVRLDRLVPSELTTRCPYKGVASYWSAPLRDGSVRENVAWSYKDPIPEIPKIKGLIAFYPQAVDRIHLDGTPVSWPATSSPN